MWLTVKPTSRLPKGSSQSDGSTSRQLHLSLYTVSGSQETLKSPLRLKCLSLPTSNLYVKPDHPPDAQLSGEWTDGTSVLFCKVYVLYTTTFTAASGRWTAPPLFRAQKALRVTSHQRIFQMSGLPCCHRMSHCTLWIYVFWNILSSLANYILPSAGCRVATIEGLYKSYPNDTKCEVMRCKNTWIITPHTECDLDVWQKHRNEFKQKFWKGGGNGLLLRWRWFDFPHHTWPEIKKKYLWICPEGRDK